MASSQATGQRVRPARLIAGAVLCSGLLFLTINSQSLWTDEAFSAYMASQNTFASLLSTLAGGDSSDLLTSMYYIYLHWWSNIFGSGEFALRAANLPFIVLFSFALSWISQRVFRSRWTWLVAVFMPFLWSYAADARAYFVLVALSTVCVGALLASLDNPSLKEQRWLPWLVLGSLFLGLTFNVLMVLVVGPLLLIVIVYERLRPGSPGRVQWKRPLKVFLLPFALLAAYVIWAISGGPPSRYGVPDMLSIASVLYRLAGLVGFAPNRRFDTAFGPYLFEMAVSGFVFLLAVAGIAWAGFHTRDRVRVLSLSIAFAFGILQVVILSLVLKQQEDVRHLAALAPLMLMLILAALSEQSGQQASRVAAASALLLGGVWIVSDIRLMVLPEHISQGEDFREAVSQAIALHETAHAGIALVADPAAGAYYGLALENKGACFPLVVDCADGFRKVGWVKKAPAEYAVDWTRQQSESWLDARAAEHVPAVVIISGTRHPMYKDSIWWQVLRSRKGAVIYRPKGFFVYYLK